MVIELWVGAAGGCRFRGGYFVVGFLMVEATKTCFSVREEDLVDSKRIKYIGER